MFRKDFEMNGEQSRQIADRAHYSADGFVLEVTLSFAMLGDGSSGRALLESGRVSFELAGGSPVFASIGGSSSFTTSFMIKADDRPSLDGLLFSSSFEVASRRSDASFAVLLRSVDETVLVRWSVDVWR